MAASGSAGRSEQEDKGSVSQNEQRIMNHFLHQALLLNAARQVRTGSFCQAHRTTEAGRTIPYREVF